MKLKKLAAALLILAFGLSLGWMGVSRAQMQRHSAQAGLKSGAIPLLEEYKRRHGAYPRSLQDLEWQEFQDGATRQDLLELDQRYRQAGDGYQLE